MATGSSTMVKVGSDGGLVLGTLAGDQATFAALYDRFATRIHDFHLALLRDPKQAQEATYQTFERAVAELNHLGEPTRLRPWLYALAYRQGSSSRWRKGNEGAVGAANGAEDDPQAALWRAAPSGLTGLDRALITLGLRHGLDDAELAAIVGVSTTRAIARLAELRPQLDRALGQLLAASASNGEPDVDTDGADPAPLRTAVPLAPAPPSVRKRVLRDIRLISAHEGLPRPRTEASWIVTVFAVIILITGTTLFVHRNMERKPVVAVRFGPSSELALSTTVLDLGATGSTATVTLSNTGSHQLAWNATPADPWLTVSPASGVLDGDKSEQLTIEVKRDTLPEGDGRTRLRVTAVGDQGVGEVAVALREERPPQIINPRANNTKIGGYGCPTVSEITATVLDESPPIRVILVGPGPQTQVMQANGNTFSGRLGSGSGADIAWKIVATDARNNTATSPTQVIAHTDCAVRPPPKPVVVTPPPTTPPPTTQSQAPTASDSGTNDSNDSDTTPSDSTSSANRRSTSKKNSDKSSDDNNQPDESDSGNDRRDGEGSGGFPF